MDVKYGMIEPRKLRKERERHDHEYQNRSEPLVSVYIPTYNRGEILIERSVTSVLKQSYKNLEIVIVGDHCTDNTAALVNDIGDSRIRFYNIPQRGYRYPPTAENHWLAGPVVAANVALGLVEGDWIARVDDDDTWTEDHVESLLNFAQDGNYEFVSGQYVSVRYGVKSIQDGVGAKSAYYTRSEVPITGENPLIGGTSTWLYRSYLKFFKYNINCWRKDWNRVNDIDISQRFFKAGVHMGFLPKVLSYV